MANTYTQIHIQAVFAVKYRERLLDKAWRDELFKYMTAIVQNEKHKTQTAGDRRRGRSCAFVLWHAPTQALSDLMREVKAGASGWINERGLVRGRFEWQEGFGGFSYSKDSISNVVAYIERQEEHHRKVKFPDEYRKMLREADIVFDEKYIFHDPI